MWYRQKPYTTLHLWVDVFLTLITSGAWLIVVIISALGRLRNR
jgi:hypothetical protein